LQGNSMTTYDAVLLALLYPLSKNAQTD
jgi:hypothetical protein